MPPADELLLLLLLVLIVGGKRRARPSSSTPATATPASPGQQVKAGDLLTPGAHYRATIKLTGLEAAFGTSAAVKAKLESTGFGNVVVADKGGGTFEATGQWAEAAKPVKLPPQVVGVWRL